MTRPLRAVSTENPAAVLTSLRQALAGGDAILPGTPRTPTPARVEQRVAVVIETSGSTGAPKRVALSADALLASAVAAESYLGGTGQWLLALPTNYIAGINVLVRSITSRFDPVYLGRGHFDVDRFAAAAQTMAAPLRFSSLVPAQLSRLVYAAEHDGDLLRIIRRLDGILVGGQSTPQEIVVRARSLGLKLTRTYGSSETCGGCVYEGSPIGATRARVIDGQVQLAGPMLAEGYVGNPAATAAAFRTEDGSRWYRTGDTGEITDGVLRVTGRLDGVIISGGEKVSLDAIEKIVRGMTGLADAVVVRSPSASWGEVPVVFVTEEATLAEVKTNVVAELGRASAPAALVRIKSIPQTPNGKPDRTALAAFAAAHGDSGHPGRYDFNRG